MRKIRLLLILGLLVLGLLFRTIHLDRSVFWVDEVATAIRAAGYTKAEVITQLSTGKPHYASDLLAYQQLTPARSWLDTVQALIRSPEHAPGYFLLTRGWMQQFGSSIGAIRSFSVLCSLLAWPCLYWFCRELTHSSTVGCTAVGLIALSPFFVAYAQEARPYSLWLLTFLFSSATFLRAVRLNSGSSWVIYSISLILSFYTSLLSLPLAIAQGIYLVTQSGRRWPYSLALTAAIVALLPWLWILLQQQADFVHNTDWMRTPIHPAIIVAIWLYSFAIVYFDVPIVASGWLALIEAVTAAIVLSILLYACYRLSRSASPIWKPLVALGLPVPLLLASLDLMFQGQASATSRYLLPCQVSLLIAAATLGLPTSALAPPAQTSMTASAPPRLAKRLARRLMTIVSPTRFRRSLMVLLLCLSLTSCLINLNRTPDYQKDRNRHNPEIAALLNQAPHPILFAAAEQTLDLLSLSHNLNPAVEMHLLPSNQIGPSLLPCRSTFLFTPSTQLRQALSQQGFVLTLIYQPLLLTAQDSHLSLWQARSRCSVQGEKM